MNIKELREEIIRNAMLRVAEAKMYPTDPRVKVPGDMVLFNIGQFKEPDGSVRPEIYRLGWLYAINHMPYDPFEDMIEDYYEYRDTSHFIISRSDLIIVAMASIAEQSLITVELAYVDGADNYDNDIMVKANKRDTVMSLRALIENEYLLMQSKYTGRDEVILEVYDKIFPTPQRPGTFAAFASTIKNVVAKSFR